MYHRRGALLFSRSSVKFEYNTAKKIVVFDPNWAFPDYNSSFFHQWLRNDAQRLKYHRRGALFFVKVIRQISRSRGQKNRRIWPKLGVSRLYLQSEFTNGYEMLHKAWSSREEMPYCFWRSSINFNGHTAHKSLILSQIRRFWTVSPVWIHQWLRNDEKASSSIEEAPYCFSGHPWNFTVTRAVKPTIWIQFE